MAYREVAMWEILNVLERLHRGESQRAVARVSGHSPKTVRRYLATAREIGWEPGTEAPTEALAGEIYRRHRPARDRDAEFARRGVERAELVAELARAEDAVDQALAGLSEDRLNEPYPVPATTGGGVSTGAMLAHLLTHMAYHLGQLDYHRRVVVGDPRGVAAISLRELTDLEGGSS